MWKTVNLDTLKFDLLLLPALAIGSLAGIWLTKFIPEKIYRYFVIVVTAAAALLLF
ncbi:MAG: hypothetical protein HC896_13160 [Bacteroidales bacterium]|nr:hypothetical protein [Bacteroidales bacterium]